MLLQVAFELTERFQRNLVAFTVRSYKKPHNLDAIMGVGRRSIRKRTEEIINPYQILVPYNWSEGRTWKATT